MPQHILGHLLHVFGRDVLAPGQPSLGSGAAFKCDRAARAGAKGNVRGGLLAVATLAARRLHDLDDIVLQHIGKMQLRHFRARALDVLRENELREPLQRDTLLTEARAWVALGRPERARAVLERSMRRWPDDAREQRALGYLELGLGRTGPARAAFERALELEPGSREAMDRLEDLSREASEDVQS